MKILCQKYEFLTEYFRKLYITAYGMQDILVIDEFPVREARFFVRKGVGAMRGQARARSYAVRLIRVSPYDERIRRYGREKHRGYGRMAAFFVKAALISSLGIGLLYFCFLPILKKAVSAEKTAPAAQGLSVAQGLSAVQGVSAAQDMNGAQGANGTQGVLPGGTQDGIQAGGSEGSPAGMSVSSGDRIELTDVSHLRPWEEQEGESEDEPKTPLIVLDPGHGGEDEGCMWEGLLEKDINLEIALRTAEQLRILGFEVALTREDNETALTPEERVAIAEDLKADIYVSIHQNACEEGEEDVRGTETWYYGKESRRLAQLVQMGVLNQSGAADRGLQEDDELYVIREASMPSCLIETGFLSGREEKNLLCDPEYQDKLAAGIAEGVNLYFNPKTMYLTFDDGPSEENTAAVLDILKEHDIKATFFVVGENVRRHPEVARRIVEEGHTIGIHCNQHEYDVIYESVESYLKDFEEAYAAVYETTGAEVKLFRFPGGSINGYNEDVYEDIIKEMTERGFIYYDWNACLEDAGQKTTPEQLIQNARQSTLKRKKVVMLAHDIVYNTVLCLEDLLDSFPEYRFEPLTEDVKPIQF